MDKLCLALWLVATIGQQTLADPDDDVKPCERVFVGSVNESYPLQVHRNGVYARLAGRHVHGRPIYKHEDHDEYLYYEPDALLRGYWVISSDAGASTAGLRVRSDALRPEAAGGEWSVLSDETGRWRAERRLKAVCVGPDFRRCSSGRVRLTGLSKWGVSQAEVMGNYTLASDTHQLRPVYKHDDAEEYIFYIDGLWLVGPQVGKPDAGMFALDFASRPEFIVQPWVAFTGRDFITEDNVHVECQEQLSEAPNSASCSDDGQCSGQGICMASGAYNFVCDCNEGYIGPTCDTPVSCGEPPAMPHGRVQYSTGAHYLAWAFYACDDGYAPVVTNAVVCSASGQWTEPVACSAGDFSSYPFSPMTGHWQRRRRRRRS